MAPQKQKGKVPRHHSMPYAKTTQLHYAARDGDFSKVNSLLQAGFDVNIQDKNGKTPIMLAMEGSHERVVELLLKFEPNVCVNDKFGKNALQMVFEQSSSDQSIVQKFFNILKKYCSNDSEEFISHLINARCPLYHAVLLNDVGVTRVMLNKGCAINLRNPGNHETALLVSLFQRDLANVKFLIESGADINAADASSRIRMSYLKSYDDSDDELEILQMFIDRSASLTARNRLCFMKCVLNYGKANALRLLFRSNIDWCTKDNDGETPLHYLVNNSILRSNPDILELLRDKKLDVSAQDNCCDETALSIATKSCFVKLVEILLDKGADPNIEDYNENSPLLNIFRFSKSEGKAEEYTKMVHLLVQHGADIQIMNRNAVTIFDRILRHDNLFLTNPVMSQLAIDETFGTPICKYAQRNIDSSDYLKDQFALCKKQLEELKRTTIHNSISAFDLVNASEKTIAVYARNPDFFHKLAYLKDCSPNLYYSDTLRRKFKNTLMLIEIKRGFADVVCEMMGIGYDSYPIVVDRIIDYVIA